MYCNKLFIKDCILIPNNTALAWNQPQWRHLRHPKICQLCRPPQPIPATPFGYQHLPLIFIFSNRNHHSQPAPWLTPLRFSKDFPDKDRGYQWGNTPEANHCRGYNEAVKVEESENKPPLPIKNFKDAGMSRDGPTPHFLGKNSKKKSW